MREFLEANRFSFPHIVVTESLAGSAQDKWAEQSLLIYAGHLLARFVLMLKKGANGLIPAQIGAIKEAVFCEDTEAGDDEQGNAFFSDLGDIRRGLETLESCGALFLEQFKQTGLSAQTLIRETLEGLGQIGKGLRFIRVLCAHPEYPERVWDWTARGEPLVLYENFQCDAPATVFVTGDDEHGFSRTFPYLCTKDLPLKPLVPFPTISGGALLESPKGSILDKGGQRHPLSMSLSGASALARLLSFYGATSDEVIAIAKETKIYGLGVEALLMRLRERVSLEDIEKIMDFLDECGQHEEVRALTPVFQQFLEKEEQRFRENSDYVGLAEVLVLRQRTETGNARVVTLQKAANVFRERLGDNEGAYTCLLAALDAMPAYDEVLVDDIVELAKEVGKEDEVVDRLLKFAETTKDAEVAVRAGAIAKGDKAKFAWRLAVRAENASLSVLDEALAFAKEAQDIELMKEVCGKIRTSTSDKDRKINATLTLAAIVSGEDPLGAAGLLEEVLRVAPDNMDALQPLLEIYLKAGKPEEARRVLEGVLKGTLVPDVRAFCLKKLVSLLLDVFKEPENAITYLEEYVALFPDDMAALELLEGLFEQRQLWQKYLMLLARKAQKDKENAVHYYLAMADCAKTRLGDEDMFAGFLARALDIDPGDHVVRLKMMDVLEKRGFFADVVRLLEDEVRQAEGDVVCDLYQKIAEVYNKRLGRRDKAKEALGKALSVAGSANVVEVASWLAGLLEEDGEIEEAKKVWEKALSYPIEDEKKVFVLKNLARIAGDIIAAKRQYLEAILSVNPLEKESALELAKLYNDASEFEKVMALLDPLLERLKDDKQFVAEALELCARAASALKMNDVALNRLKALAELRPEETKFEILIAKELQETANHEEALSKCEELLNRELPPQEKVEVLRLAYESCVATQKDARALEYKEALVQLEGKRDFNTVMELVSLSEKAQDKGRLVRYLIEALGLAPDAQSRFVLKMRLGELHSESGEHYGALRWFMDASKESGASKVALFNALREAEEVQDLETRAQVLRQLIEVEMDVQKRARLKYPLALFEIKKGAKAKAKDLLWSAIKDDPNFDEARKALENILIADYDSEGLRELYETLLRQARASGDKERVIALLEKLLDIYDKALKNPEQAMSIISQILEVKGDDKEMLERLARVASETLGNEKVMLDAHRRVLAIDPTHVDSYKAIKNIFSALKDEEGLWCASGTLLALGLGGEEEKAIYEKGREPALRLKRDSLPKADFDRLIRHKDANVEVAAVFHILYQALLRLLSWKKPSDLGLGEQDVIVPRGKNLFENMALAVSKIMGVPLPKLYRAKGRLGVAKLAFNPPALAIGDDCIETWRGKEIRFAMGRALVSFMPGFEMAGIVADAATLKPFFLAGIKVVMPDFAVPQDVAGVSELAGELRELLDEESKKQLKNSIDAFRQSRRPIDIVAFLEGIDKTASRTGFFLCNDILVAGQVLKDDPLFFSDLEYDDKLLDLCAYSISERYFELRKLMLKGKQ